MPVMAELPACPRCERNWRRDREGMHCLAHGPYAERVVRDFVEEARRRPPAPGTREGKPWTEDELAFVRAHLADMTCEGIGQRLGRSGKAIEARIQIMGWEKRYVRSATPVEEEVRFVPGPRLSAEEVLLLRLVEGEGGEWAVSAGARARALGVHRVSAIRLTGRLAAMGLLEAVRLKDGFWGYRPTLLRLTAAGRGYLAWLRREEGVSLSASAIGPGGSSVGATRGGGRDGRG